MEIIVFSLTEEMAPGRAERRKRIVTDPKDWGHSFLVVV